MEKWSEGITENFKAWILEEEDSRAVEILYLMHGVEVVIPDFVDAFKRELISRDFLEECVILGVHRLLLDEGAIGFGFYDALEGLGAEWVEFVDAVEEKLLYSEDAYDPEEELEGEAVSYNFGKV